jgi:hypothetical protein
MHASDIVAEIQRLIQIHGDVTVKCVMEKTESTVTDIRYASGGLSTKPTIKIIA